MSAGVSGPQETQIRLACTLWGNPRPALRFLVMCLFSQSLTKWGEKERTWPPSTATVDVPMSKVSSATSFNFPYPVAQTSSWLSLSSSLLPIFPIRRKKRERQLSLAVSSPSAKVSHFYYKLIGWSLFPKAVLPRGKTKVISIRALGETSSISFLFVHSAHVYGAITVCLARCTTWTERSLPWRKRGAERRLNMQIAGVSQPSL